jgi:predicted transcriptional regulator
MSTASIKLPDPLDRQLTAIAKQRHTTRTKALRDALKAYADAGTKPKRRSASELAADLMFDGPGDLSTNPKYMAGYGR